MPSPSRRDITELDHAPAFPRLDASFVQAMNRLLDLRRAPLALPLAAESLALHWDAQPLAPLHEAYRFRLGAHGGWLALDAAAQTLLLGERRSELLPRELRYVLLAEALQPAVDQLERRFRVRFEWTPDDEDAARQAAAVTAHTASFRLLGTEGGASASGYLRFDSPDALAAHVPPLATRERPPPAPALDRLRFALNFCLGRTQIRLREVRAIRPGDIVSLETWDPLGSALRVTARVGGAHGRRLVALAEGNRITLQPTKGSPMNRDPMAGSDDDTLDDNGSPAIDRLDALEVTLRFEVGELGVSLGELKALRPGHVFELPQPLNRSTVRILAHGNVLGKGHLVAVGDRLGVRVAEFAAADL